MSEQLGMYLYVIGTAGSSLVKIGRTTHDPYRRLASISTMSPVPLDLRAYWRTDLDAEKRLHQLFADRRQHGEWFDFGDVDPVEAVAEALGQQPEPLRPDRADLGLKPESEIEADEADAMPTWRPSPLDVTTLPPLPEPVERVTACANCTSADHVGLTGEQYIAHVVDQAPPLSRAQLDRLHGLLKPALTR